MRARLSHVVLLCTAFPFASPRLVSTRPLPDPAAPKMTDRLLTTSPSPPCLVPVPSVEPVEKEDDERARLARRQILQKYLPADEETLKLHLERLIFVSGRIRSKKARDGSRHRCFAASVCWPLHGLQRSELLVRRADC